MKNDVRKVEKITTEMIVNDIVFKCLVLEYSKLAEAIDIGHYESIEETLEKAYFYRRVISLLENNDLPMRAAIGLFCPCNTLKAMYSCRSEFIGDSDSDADLYKMIIEFGYRMYDALHDPKVVNEICRRVSEIFSKETEVAKND